MTAAPHTVGETDLYIARCDKLGLSEDVRSAIIDQVALDPAAGVVIRGSGGIRKVRFGGSGGYRVLVTYFDEHSPAYLMSVLSKGQRANFTDAQINVLYRLTKEIKVNIQKYRR